DVEPAIANRQHARARIGERSEHRRQALLHVVDERHQESPPGVTTSKTNVARHLLVPGSLVGSRSSTLAKIFTVRSAVWSLSAASAESITQRKRTLLSERSNSFTSRT